MADASVTTKTIAGTDVKARFGTFLRQAREKSGLSIEAVAQETKISKQFIIFLETGSVENLPGQVFGRGFIKNIARYLRSDSGEMLRLYDACWGIDTAGPAKAAETVEEVASIQKSAVIEERTKAPEIHAASTPVDVKSVKRQSNRGSQATSSIPDIPHLPSVDENRKRYGIGVPTWFVRSIMSPHVRLSILGGVAAVMVIGVLGRWIGANMQRPAAKSNETTPSSVVPSAMNQSSTDDGSVSGNVEVSPADAVPLNVVEKSLTVPGDAKDTAMMRDSSASVPVTTGPQAAVVAASSTAAEEESPLQVQQGTPIAFDQILELNISSPVEIKMTIDGKKQENTSFRADQHRFTFHERAELMISDASAVEIIYNGKSLGVLGNKGRKRRIFFQAKPSETEFPH